MTRTDTPTAAAAVGDRLIRRLRAAHRELELADHAAAMLRHPRAIGDTELEAAIDVAIGDLSAAIDAAEARLEEA